MSSIGSGPGIGSGSQLDVSALRGVGAVDARSVNVATTQTDAADATAATGQSVAAQAATAQSASVVTTNAFTAGDIPVDQQRVSEIKKALETGTYPILPTKIGDAMVAAGLMLRTAQ